MTKYWMICRQCKMRVCIGGDSFDSELRRNALFLFKRTNQDPGDRFWIAEFARFLHDHFGHPLEFVQGSLSFHCIASNKDGDGEESLDDFEEFDSDSAGWPESLVEAFSVLHPDMKNSRPEPS